MSVAAERQKLPLYRQFRSHITTGFDAGIFAEHGKISRDNRQGWIERLT
nr:hypothetical protein [uncultured Cohaesibacter sp.]